MGIVVKKKTISNLQANVFTVHDPMFPLYVIRGKENLLIDCSILAKAEDIEIKLNKLLGKEKIDLVLLTHSHYDHTGACAYLQARHHFNILASQRTKEILQNHKAIEFIDKLNQEFKHLLNQDNSMHVTMPENISTVHEGDKISVSQNQWLQVYETPGHTRCSLAFLLQPENILFPGDAAGVMEKKGAIKPLFLSSYSAYIESLKKIDALETEILALPHNQVIKGRKNVHEFFSCSLLETKKLKNKIFQELQLSADFNAIAEKLFSQEYSLPSIDGPREALLLNLTAMVKSIYYEFVKIVE